MLTPLVAGYVLLRLSLEARGEEAGTSQSRSCEFYESHAYPATYDVDLNATCGARASAPLTRNPAFALDLGLFAAREFPEGAVVVWVPEGVHLWEPNIPWPVRHAVADVCKPHAYDESVLAVALLVERRDANSRFKHYAAALAQLTTPEMGNIAAFAEDHLRVLNASRPDLVAHFRDALRCMAAAEASLGALREAPPSEGERLWAYGIVRTRALRLQGRLALVPVIDLANHAVAPNAAIGVHELGGGLLRSLRRLAPGEEITISYRRRASNLELLATHGFAMRSNRVGPLLPVDFTVAIDASDDEGQSLPDPGGACKDALSSPHLERGGRLLLEWQSARCLEDRLFRYYEQHPAEINALSPLHIAAKGVQLLGTVCGQVFEEYRKVSTNINRLQQHGQRVQDWLMLQVAHEAVEDMRLLTSCVDAPPAYGDTSQAQQRMDL